MKSLQPVYFALDFETGEEALNFLQAHQLKSIPVKVGMELFYREGPEMIQKLKEDGHSIFLDLKLHDIPETVCRAMRNLAKLDVDVVNVHAQGGSTMMEAAKKGLEEGAKAERPLLLAVTILTSTDQTMVEKELLLDRPVSEIVEHYGELAEKSGADGVVCSVEEAALIKEYTNLYALTPGIRLEGSETHDQKRVATPMAALERGSDSIVVGRAIRDAEDPYATYQQIKEEFTREIHHS
ncbi:orotidine-5'-phosphate decarboxylase [Halobacillus sp. BBL2006]|uniref:orotidine-5'-phosphate decarboxylase n=1 Tax=Halobacillus sp. BBL2006 TaxID=1543706 RepID=UPI0005421B7B|nr:orotidine-5'-phosphate decarboxylase [Halobacillus sp. BBL2006]KHE71202.1 orotidine 5'-phosphate decarboxylase [Halobacillus sp. BBL2006]